MSLLISHLQTSLLGRDLVDLICDRLKAYPKMSPVPFEPPILSDALSNNPGQRFIILTSSAAHAVGIALREGEDTSSSISLWRETTEAALTLFRRNRMRIRLVDAEAFAAAPSAFLDNLEAWMAGDYEPECAAPSSPPVRQALFELVARLALSRSAGLATLEQEYEASLAPISSEPPSVTFDTDALAAELRSLLDAERIQERLKADETESKAQADLRARERDAQAQVLARQRDALVKLQTGISSHQSTLEWYYSETARLEGEIEAVRGKCESQREELDGKNKLLSEELDKALAAQSADTADKKLLRSQVRALTEERDFIRAELGDLKSRAANLASERDRLAEEVAGLRTSLEQLRASTSWKITAPIRGVRQAFVKAPATEE